MGNSNLKMCINEVIDNPEGINRESCKKIIVKTHSPTELNFKIDLIKLDVGGADVGSLNSMKKIFKEIKSTTLVKPRRPGKTEKDYVGG